MLSLLFLQWIVSRVYKSVLNWTAFFCQLIIGSGGVDAKHPKNRFFFVSAVTTGVDANSREFTSFSPAFDGESRDAEKGGDFGDGQKIWEIGQINIFGSGIWFGILILVLVIH